MAGQIYMLLHAYSIFYLSRLPCGLTFSLFLVSQPSVNILVVVSLDTSRITPLEHIVSEIIALEDV